MNGGQESGNLTSGIASITQITGTVPNEVKELYKQNNTPKGTTPYKPKTVQITSKNAKIQQYFQKSGAGLASAFGASRPQECAQHYTGVVSADQLSTIIKANEACSEAKSLVQELSTLNGNENLTEVIKKNAQMILKSQEAQESLI